VIFHRLAVGPALAFAFAVVLAFCGPASAFAFSGVLALAGMFIFLILAGFLAAVSLLACVAAGVLRDGGCTHASRETRQSGAYQQITH
jgi:hypothetical protein